MKKTRGRPKLTYRTKVVPFRVNENYSERFKKEVLILLNKIKADEENNIVTTYFK
jgi:hypothetical protein